MKKVNIWDVVKPELITYYNDIDSILKYITENKLMRFQVLDNDGLDNGKVGSHFVEIFNDKAKNSEIELNYFDNNHRVFVDNLGKDVLIDTVIDAAGVIDKSKNVQERIELLNENASMDIKCFPLYYDYVKKFLETHLEDVALIFKDTASEFPSIIESLDEESKKEIYKDPYIIDFLKQDPEDAFKFGGCYVFAKIINDIMPNMKFAVKYHETEKRPCHIMLRNNETYFDIGYTEVNKENYLIENNLEYKDASVNDLLFADDKFYNFNDTLQKVFESKFKSNLRSYLYYAIAFENEKSKKI